MEIEDKEKEIRIKKETIEKILRRLLNNIKTEGVNDFDNISFHRSFYGKNLEVKK